MAFKRQRDSHNIPDQHEAVVIASLEIYIETYCIRIVFSCADTSSDAKSSENKPDIIYL